MKTRTALGIAIFTAALAARADPRFEWKTVETPHFEIHYHQGNEQLAQKSARLAEESHRRLAPLLDHLPTERCQVIILDDTDFANGSATPLLYNTIHLFAPPPDTRSELSDVDDYLYELISHEYTHILHLDTVLGLPAITNDIFGKLWVPNGGQPGWFIEGMAVFAESEVSASGRVRSSQDEMVVRAEILEGRFPDIDKLSNLPLEWPRTRVWYTLGGRFLTWIADQYGLGALRDLSHDFGSRPIPLAMNISATQVLGKSYLDLFVEFREYEAARAQQVQRNVSEGGETRVEELTRLGERTRSPRWSLDGTTLYYANQGPDHLPELRALEPGPCCDPARRLVKPTRPEDRRLAETFGEDEIAVDAAGRIVYSRVEIYQQFEELEDLYRLDPKTGHEERLTRGLRAREPDVAPDGTIAFVWRRPGGHTAIATLAPGSTEPRVLFDDAGGEPVGSPRWSPSGDKLAFAHHRNGTWDLRLVGRDGVLTDLTHDRAFHRDPAWSPDGRYLLFSSDRTGVYDLYAIRLDDGVLLRVTSVVLGAFEPAVSPDLTQIALVSYSSRGYDLARMPYAPWSWKEVEAPPISDARPPVTALPPEELYPVRDYNPLPTLRPHFWLPYAATDALGTTLGALTYGYDAVDRHEYAATAWWALDSKQPGWELSYTNKTLYPDLLFSFGRDLVNPAGAGTETERSIHGGIEADFHFDQIARGQTLFAAYDATQYSMNTANTDPNSANEKPGLLSTATVGYRYSDARRFVRSISAEEGTNLSLTLRLADPALGSAFSYQQLVTTAAHYFLMPWEWNGRSLHHALAVRGSFGLSSGDLSGRRLYGLGGFNAGNPIQTLINPGTAPIRVLRGFSRNAFVGTDYLLGTAEYRFPIANIEIGAWTLPFYLRRLHGALFADTGDAFSPSAHDFKLHTGAGVELRAEVVLGYILPTNLRFGCAHGLEKSDAAIFDCYAALGGIF